MRVNSQPLRSIQVDDDGVIRFIDQRQLPHDFVRVELRDLTHAAQAISEMWVRGAPLIGATAAWGLALQMASDPSDASLDASYQTLYATRPTAVNLRWALDRMRTVLLSLPTATRASAAWTEAQTICDEDVAANAALGRHALALIRELWEQKGRPQQLNLLTHCNAGWLATVAWGTATAGIYLAHNEGIPVHVWVDETRPRNQGARLTAWELGQHGVPHTVIVDNVGGHLMQHGLVDACIVGTDRTTRSGDVCNKIGTYLKALAAHDNHIPFWVALPSSTIDWTVSDGIREIPIEERSTFEVHNMRGLTADGTLETVRLTPPQSRAANHAFDVTPARYVTRLITERGACAASEAGLLSLFPDAQ